MSSVNPPEGYNSYYMKHLTELEDDMKKELARGQQRLREREDELEQDYRNALSEREADSEETVADIREKMSEASAKERESARAEIERARRMNYDKNGRNRANEADSLR